MAARRAPRRRLNKQTGTGSVLRVRGDLVTLANSDTPQSSVDLSDPTDLHFEYMQHMDLALRTTVDALSWDQQHLRAFHAGGGALALPLAWEQRFPLMTQTALDTDTDLVEEMRSVARLNRSRKIRFKAGDAEAALLRSNATYDVLVRDAFAGETTPANLQTLQWHQLVYSRLRPNGIYLANVGHDTKNPGKSDIAGMAEVFPKIAVITDPKVWRSGRIGNLVAVGWKGHSPNLDVLERSVRSLPLVVRFYHPNQVSKWLAGARYTEVRSPTTPGSQRVLRLPSNES